MPLSDLGVVGKHHEVLFQESLHGSLAGLLPLRCSSIASMAAAAATTRMRLSSVVVRSFRPGRSQKAAAAAGTRITAVGLPSPAYRFCQVRPGSTSSGPETPINFEQFLPAFRKMKKMEKMLYKHSALLTVGGFVLGTTVGFWFYQRLYYYKAEQRASDLDSRVTALEDVTPSCSKQPSSAVLDEILDMLKRIEQKSYGVPAQPSHHENVKSAEEATAD